MIRYLRHSEIDRRKWDLCIADDAASLIYGFSWFLDIVSPQWEALVLDEYDAVMPLTRLSKWGIRYLSQPLFTQQLGVFAKHQNPQIVREFLDALPLYIRYTDVYLNEHNNIVFPPEAVVVQRKTQFLNIEKSWQEVEKDFSPKLRRSVRKGREAGLSVIEDVPVSTAQRMFVEHNWDKLENHGKKEADMLEKLMNTVQEKGYAKVFAARLPSGELCASAFFICYGSRMVYFKGSITEEGRATRALAFLLSECIQAACNLYKVFDFGGSVVPGVEHFFGSFGAKDKIYCHYVSNHLPWPLRILKK